MRCDDGRWNRATFSSKAKAALNIYTDARFSEQNALFMQSREPGWRSGGHGKHDNGIEICRWRGTPTSHTRAVGTAQFGPAHDRVNRPRFFLS